MARARASATRGDARRRGIRRADAGAPTPTPRRAARPRRAPRAAGDATRARGRARERCARRCSAARTPRRSRAVGRGDAATARALAAAARVPHGDPLHPPGRRRDASRWRACGAADCARPRRATPSPRTCSTPTRRACASCSTTPPAAHERGLPDRRAEAAAQAAGYFAILAAALRAGPRRARRPRAPRARFAALAARRSPAATPRPRRARARADRALEGFTAAPFTRRGGGAPRPAAAALPRARARSSTAAASRTTRVTLDFEIQEAVAFRTGAEAAFADLRDAARQARPRRAPTPIGAQLDRARRRSSSGATADDRGRRDRRRRRRR